MTDPVFVILALLYTLPLWLLPFFFSAHSAYIIVRVFMGFIVLWARVIHTYEN